MFNSLRLEKMLGVGGLHLGKSDGEDGQKELELHASQSLPYIDFKSICCLWKIQVLFLLPWVADGDYMAAWWKWMEVARRRQLVGHFHSSPRPKGEGGALK